MEKCKLEGKTYRIILGTGIYFTLSVVTKINYMYESVMVVGYLTTLYQRERLFSVELCEGGRVPFWKIARNGRKQF
jgi:hypothetical protein